MFWSGDELSIRLPTLITPFDINRIDCAAYTLSVGSEVFVTEDLPPTGDPRKSVKLILGPNDPFRIPPGQFAFLTTEEHVEVPSKNVAFISMKATYKFRGLVNVSGFHVDPGWNGPLIFSVYNAGPATVHLSRGLALFLIWYAELDRNSSSKYTYTRKGTPGLRDDLISNMSGQVFSPMNLSRQLDQIRESNMELKVELGGFKKLTYGVGGVLVTILLAIVSGLGEPFLDFIFQRYTARNIKTMQSTLESVKPIPPVDLNLIGDRPNATPSPSLLPADKQRSPSEVPSLPRPLGRKMEGDVRSR